jgi:hypothetical protein
MKRYFWRKARISARCPRFTFNHANAIRGAILLIAALAALGIMAALWA